MKIITLKFMKLIIIIFMNDIKKKHKLIKTVMNIYYLKLIFSLMNIIVDIEEKDGDKDLNFELSKQEILEEEINYSFIRINTNNDLDYEISYIQKFINEMNQDR